VGIDSDKWVIAATKLFNEIWTDLGEADARRIFNEIAGPRTPEQEIMFRNFELLAHWRGNLPKPIRHYRFIVDMGRGAPPIRLSWVSIFVGCSHAERSSGLAFEAWTYRLRNVLDISTLECPGHFDFDLGNRLERV
jgi:hypothetical protein